VTLPLEVPLIATVTDSAALPSEVMTVPEIEAFCAKANVLKVSKRIKRVVFLLHRKEIIVLKGV
jgi:hypothetical protein